LLLRPQVAIVLSTYQRPGHLYRSLVSLCQQRDVDGEFEVVVADDGSTDSTADMVRHFARKASFPLDFTTHHHRGYWLARSRNEGAAATTGPYLIFTDGDCVFPPDFVFLHLALRKHGVAYSGDRVKFDRRTTERVQLEDIISGDYESWIPARERRRLYVRSLKDRFYEAIHHHKKPKLIGCHIAVWRSDFERVNGFDERFVGWGCEDDDFAQRLRMSGIRIRSVLGRIRIYHMWHPPHPTHTRTWRHGCNVAYFERPDKPIRCVRGLVSEQSELSLVFSDEHYSYPRRSGAVVHDSRETALPARSEAPIRRKAA
jgi:GT2 family glycosyltransferase